MALNDELTGLLLIVTAVSIAVLQCLLLLHGLRRREPSLHVNVQNQSTNNVSAAIEKPTANISTAEILEAIPSSQLRQRHQPFLEVVDNRTSESNLLTASSHEETRDLALFPFSTNAREASEASETSNFQTPLPHEFTLQNITLEKCVVITNGNPGENASNLLNVENAQIRENQDNQQPTILQNLDDEYSRQHRVAVAPPPYSESVALQSNVSLKLAVEENKTSDANPPPYSGSGTLQPNASLNPADEQNKRSDTNDPEIESFNQEAQAIGTSRANELSRIHDFLKKTALSGIGSVDSNIELDNQRLHILYRNIVRRFGESNHGYNYEKLAVLLNNTRELQDLEEIDAQIKKGLIDIIPSSLLLREDSEENKPKPAPSCGDAEPDGPTTFDHTWVCKDLEPFTFEVNAKGTCVKTPYCEIRFPEGAVFKPKIIEIKVDYSNYQNQDRDCDQLFVSPTIIFKSESEMTYEKGVEVHLDVNYSALNADKPVPFEIHQFHGIEKQTSKRVAHDDQTRVRFVVQEFCKTCKLYVTAEKKQKPNMARHFYSAFFHHSPQKQDPESHRIDWRISDLTYETYCKFTNERPGMKGKVLQAPEGFSVETQESMKLFLHSKKLEFDPPRHEPCLLYLEKIGDHPVEKCFPFNVTLKDGQKGTDQLRVTHQIDYGNADDKIISRNHFFFSWQFFLEEVPQNISYIYASGKYSTGISTSYHQIEQNDLSRRQDAKQLPPKAKHPPGENESDVSCFCFSDENSSDSGRLRKSGCNYQRLSQRKRRSSNREKRFDGLQRSSNNLKHLSKNDEESERSYRSDNAKCFTSDERPSAQIYSENHPGRKSQQLLAKGEHSLPRRDYSPVSEIYSLESGDGSHERGYESDNEGRFTSSWRHRGQFCSESHLGRRSQQRSTERKFSMQRKDYLPDKERNMQKSDDEPHERGYGSDNNGRFTSDERSRGQFYGESHSGRKRQQRSIERKFSMQRKDYLPDSKRNMQKSDDGPPEKDYESDNEGRFTSHGRCRDQFHSESHLERKKQQRSIKREFSMQRKDYLPDSKRNVQKSDDEPHEKGYESDNEGRFTGHGRRRNQFHSESQLGRKRQQRSIERKFSLQRSDSPDSERNMQASERETQPLSVRPKRLESQRAKNLSSGRLLTSATNVQKFPPRKIRPPERHNSQNHRGISRYVKELPEGAIPPNFMSDNQNPQFNEGSYSMQERLISFPGRLSKINPPRPIRRVNSEITPHYSDRKPSLKKYREQTPYDKDRVFEHENSSESENDIDSHGGNFRESNFIKSMQDPAMQRGCQQSLEVSNWREPKYHHNLSRQACRQQTSKSLNTAQDFPHQPRANQPMHKSLSERCIFDQEIQKKPHPSEDQGNESAQNFESLTLLSTERSQSHKPPVASVMPTRLLSSQDDSSDLDLT